MGVLHHQSRQGAALCAATFLKVEVIFRGKTATAKAKHIEALMKLLEKRAVSFKVWSEEIPDAQK